VTAFVTVKTMILVTLTQRIWRLVKQASVTQIIVRAGLVVDNQCCLLARGICGVNSPLT